MYRRRTVSYAPAMRLVAGLILTLALVACGRGDKELGEACGDDRECAVGLCVAGVDGDAPVCTRSCARTTDCPEGWTCSGATQDNVLICVHRPSTPFGH